jgi:hypothetical protein
MTVTTVYIVFSTVLFILFSLLLNGEHWVTAVLRGFSIVMAIVGVIVGMASMGIVMSNGIRLI